jgi:hypothetical protein
MNNSKANNNGLGSRRKTLHTTMLISILLAGKVPRNESVCQARLIQFGYWHITPLQCRFTGHELWGKIDWRRFFIMTWISTIPLSEADEQLRKAMEDQKLLYPKEYATPVHPVEGGGSSIVASHSLIPEALYHAFATFGTLMSPDLPLSRRQHEMITTMVSVTNRCVY